MLNTLIFTNFSFINNSGILILYSALPAEIFRSHNRFLRASLISLCCMNRTKQPIYYACMCTVGLFSFDLCLPFITQCIFSFDETFLSCACHHFRYLLLLLSLSLQVIFIRGGRKKNRFSDASRFSLQLWAWFFFLLSTIFIFYFFTHNITEYPK